MGWKEALFDILSGSLVQALLRAQRVDSDIIYTLEFWDSWQFEQQRDVSTQ